MGRVRGGEEREGVGGGGRGVWRGEEHLRRPRAAKRRKCLLVGKLHLLRVNTLLPLHTLLPVHTLREVQTLREGAAAAAALQSEESASW